MILSYSAELSSDLLVLWQTESATVAAVSVAWQQHDVDSVRCGRGRRRRHLRGRAQRDAELPRTHVRREESTNLIRAFIQRIYMYDCIGVDMIFAAEVHSKLSLIFKFAY